MYKPVVILIIVLKLATVDSCRTQSVISCEERKYKNFDDKNALITKLSSSVRINSVSLVGTHQSLSYLSGNGKNKTQELDIVFQLKHGVRVLHLIVKPQKNDLQIYSGSMYLPQVFDDTMKKISTFMEFNPREFVMVILDSSINEIEDNYCPIIDWYIQNNELVGWRLVKDWSFNDRIGIYRGKILLATFRTSFQNCAVNLGTECKFEDSIASSVAEKWSKIIDFQEKSYLENRNCFIHKLSINTDRGARANAKYGGYFVNDNCVEPINVKMAKFFYPTKRGMFIVMADYVTPDLIDRVHSGNNWTLDTMYYWEKIKKKYLYNT